ncbi:hypothetical protein KC866_00475 [Patescibacteria group bacterium]|nr:hypothetical protein [Patescibacteria group bacterium]
MKKQHILIAVLGLALIVVLVIVVRRTQNNSFYRYGNDVLSGSTMQLCFLYEATPQDIPNVEEGAMDREYIELSVSEEGGVTGTHRIVPYRTDSNFATFVGVTDGTFVNVIATANAEGETWREQRVYKLDGDNLFVGYQPVYVPRYKNENNIYMYEDINKLIFETDTFFLPRVACDAVDLPL